MSFTVLVGNPKPESRTLGVAAPAAQAHAGRMGLRSGNEQVDQSGQAPRLLLDEACAAREDALAPVHGADLLLVVSPTFKGTYSGLLKVFLDRLPYRGLSGATALPLLVMRSPEHALAVEVHLRPLLVELGASVPAPGLALLESDLDRLDSVLRGWAAQAAVAMGGMAITPEAAMAGRP